MVHRSDILVTQQVKGQTNRFVCPSTCWVTFSTVQCSGCGNSFAQCHTPEHTTICMQNIYVYTLESRLRTGRLSIWNQCFCFKERIVQKLKIVLTASMIASMNATHAAICTDFFEWKNSYLNSQTWATKNDCLAIEWQSSADMTGKYKQLQILP